MGAALSCRPSSMASCAPRPEMIPGHPLVCPTTVVARSPDRAGGDLGDLRSMRPARSGRAFAQTGFGLTSGTVSKIVIPAALLGGNPAALNPKLLTCRSKDTGFPPRSAAGMTLGSRLPIHLAVSTKGYLGNNLGRPRHNLARHSIERISPKKWWAH